ncbi:MAG: N-acyl homoserine lactone hydrolase [Frankiales bacterium]|nr:N-acyl homoserine lactone hydrolase [Frankiales bacterium]
MPAVETLLQGNFLDSTQGALVFCSVTLVEGLDSDGVLRRVVVDTGSSGREGALRAALATRGLTGSDIDTVVLTHAHWDHVQNLDMFDGVPLLLHPRELDHISGSFAGDAATPRWTKAVLDRYDVRPVSDGVELLPGVVVLEAAGHSAGSIAVQVQTDDGVAVICGDAIQDCEVARSGRNPLVLWDSKAASSSISRLVTAADVLYPGHDLAFRISATGAVEHVQEPRLTLTGSAEQVARVRVAPDLP